MAARIHITNPRSSRIGFILIRLFVALGLVGGLAAGQGLLAAYVVVAQDLPPIPPFDAIRFGRVDAIRASHGQLLAEVFQERRYLVPRERLPQVLVDAVLASEDSRFFEHAGLDLVGIFRALWTNLRAGDAREGASTLTQQLARTLLLGHEKTLSRKAREAILARRIEDIYTKDQILLLYLNLIFLGNGAYGVQAASRVYFGKDVSELTLSEAAIIATLPQSPGKVNPVLTPDETRVRRDRVLRRMRETGRISAEQEAAARAEPVVVVPPRDNLGDRAPIAAIEALKQLQALTADPGRNLADAGGGVTAWLTVDLGLQAVAQEALSQAVAALDRRQGYRGPLGNIEPAKWPEFFRRNADWLAKHGGAGDLPYGTPVLGVVTEARADLARVQVTADLSGTLPIAMMSWAVPYTEFPISDPTTGARQELPRVSLDGKLDAVDKALKVGDVILVVRSLPPKRPPPPPKPKKGKKKASQPVEAPQPVQETGPIFALYQFPRPQGALLATEPREGYILAQVGGTDFDLSQVNRTQSLRQSGSTVKPIYYSKAYDLGIAPSTMVSGAPYREGNWAPEGETAVPDMTLYQALTQSENNVSLRVFRMVLDRVGPEGLTEWARRLGLSRPFQGFTAESLGIDIKPEELLTAMSTFATGGFRPDFHLLKLVRDGTGRTILDHRSSRDPLVPVLDAVGIEAAEPSPTRAITQETAWMVAHNLRNVVEEGTAKKARRLPRPAHGKTGTLPFDVWFVGWTHELAAVAWIGQDLRERSLGRNLTKGGVFGADTALPAWLDFVTVVTRGRPPVDDLARVPAGIVLVSIDPETGLLAHEGAGMDVPHLKGTEPTLISGDREGRPETAETAEF